MLTATVLTVVALVAGMNVFGGALDVFGMYALALLINVAGVLWAAGVAMRFRTMQAGPVMQMPVFLILFFAPVYVPLELLTGWIETIATLNPITYVLEAVRSMLAGDEVYVAAAFAIALGLVRHAQPLVATAACAKPKPPANPAAARSPLRSPRGSPGCARSRTGRPAAAPPSSRARAARSPGSP